MTTYFVVIVLTFFAHSQFSIEELVGKGFESRWLRPPILSRIAPLHMIVLPQLY